jgi:hypothetical protein
MLNNMLLQEVKELFHIYLLNVRDLAAEVASGDLSDKSGCLHRKPCNRSYPANLFSLLKECLSLLFSAG